MSDTGMPLHREPLPECIKRLTEAQVEIEGLKRSLYEYREDKLAMYDQLNKHDGQLQVVIEFTAEMKRQMPPAIEKIQRANGAIPDIKKDIERLNGKMDSLSNMVMKCTGVAGFCAFILVAAPPLIDLIKKMFGGG